MMIASKSNIWQRNQFRSAASQMHQTPLEIQYFLRMAKRVLMRMTHSLRHHWFFTFFETGITRAKFTTCELFVAPARNGPNHIERALGFEGSQKCVCVISSKRYRHREVRKYNRIVFYPIFETLVHLRAPHDTSICDSPLVYIYIYIIYIYI